MSRRKVVTWIFCFLFLVSFLGSALLFAIDKKSASAVARGGVAVAGRTADPIAVRVGGLEKRLRKVEQMAGATSKTDLKRIDFEEIYRKLLKKGE